MVSSHLLLENIYWSIISTFTFIWSQIPKFCIEFQNVPKKLAVHMVKNLIYFFSFFIAWSFFGIFLFQNTWSSPKSINQGIFHFFIENAQVASFENSYYPIATATWTNWRMRRLRKKSYLKIHKIAGCSVSSDTIVIVTDHNSAVKCGFGFFYEIDRHISP